MSEEQQQKECPRFVLVETTLKTTRTCRAGSFYTQRHLEDSFGWDFFIAYIVP